MSRATVALATPSPPGLAEATKNSQSAWQEHLAELFRRAKERFPDVVWELTAEDDDARVVDEVWGHKAIVYARAPPSFQSRYFLFRPHPVSSQSALSLTSPSRSPSPTLAPNTSLLRISTAINPALFSNELEYLYTGQGFGEAFEFLFDSADTHDGDNQVDPDDLRIDKLRKDLVYMWRSRLYSDVRIALSGTFSASHENTTAIFSSHRFILVARSPYFHDALLSWPQKPSAPAEQPTVTLPSPPFTPPSLHFTLGFIYTGTLIFSHRTFDLSTAFAILKSALYLSLPSLHDEIQARIAHEMLHGLFHAFLPFQEYERLTAGKWGTGGCRCRQCARRVPRVLEFSLEDDVKNTHLERGARRALVGLYGEGWCTHEFATLNPKLRDSLLKGVAKRTTPQNVFPLLFSADHALAKLSSNVEPWADTVRDLILAGRKVIDEAICKDPEAAFSSEEWLEIMQGDGTRFDDSERAQWAMAAVLRGVKEPWAASLYQTLVSSILIKPHPTEPNSPFLPSTSQVRQQVEQTRIELVKWMSKRWLQIRQDHGFDALEGWAIKELSDYMEVPIDDLLSPTPPVRGSPRHKNTSHRPVSNHPHTSRIDADSETASSMRVSVLSRNLASRRGPPSVRDNASVHSSVSSIRSARSAVSTNSTASDSTIGRSSRTDTVNTGMSPARRIIQATRARDAANAAKDRPDSKLTPASPPVVDEPRAISPVPQPSLRLSLDEHDDQQNIEDDAGALEEDNDDTTSVAASDTPTEPDSTPIKKTLITRPSLTPPASRSQAGPRTKPAPASVRSHGSTTRKPTVSVTSRQSLAKPATATASSRPTSRASTRTSTASTFSRTSVTRSTASTLSSRPVSAVSTVSSAANNRTSTLTAESAGTYRTASSGLSTPQQPRSRKSSAASTSSVRTAGPGPSSPSSPISPSSRTRKVSGASASSGNSAASSSAYGTAKSSVSRAAGPPPPLPADPWKLSPASAKPGSSVIRPVKSVSSINRKKTTATGVIKTSVSGSAATNKTSPVSPAAEFKSPVLDTSSPVEDKENKDVPGELVVRPNEEEEYEEEMRNTPSTMTIKPRMKNNSNEIAAEHKKTDSTASTGSNVTIKKKPSNETIVADITPSQPAPASSSPRTSPRTSRSSGGSSEKSRLLDKPQPPLPIPVPVPVPVVEDVPAAKPSPPMMTIFTGEPRGVTLDIGIPCIVSSKRKRFKAYARYIGEVEGEYGPWVGVEVPIPLGESWADRDVDGGWHGAQWNDGTWGGIKYFDVGSRSSDWDYSYDERDRATRRRRVDPSGGASSWSSSRDYKGVGIKREGDQLSTGMERMKRMRSASPAVSDASGAESRGLFVRPQQVLYVVDAVEDL